MKHVPPSRKNNQVCWQHVKQHCCHPNEQLSMRRLLLYFSSIFCVWWFMYANSNRLFKSHWGLLGFQQNRTKKPKVHELHLNTWIFMGNFHRDFEHLVLQGNQDGSSHFGSPQMMLAPWRWFLPLLWYTPRKINMEHNHGGLEDHFPF